VTAAPSSPTLRILVDCDGVLSDFVGLVLDFAESHYGLRYRRECIDRWNHWECMNIPDLHTRLAALVGPLELCRRMLPLQGAAAFLAGLERLGEVKVATTPMNAAWMAQRATWLEDFGVPLARQIHMHGKADLARGGDPNAPGWDILIDDHAENCEAFQAAGGWAFCIAAPYNEHVDANIPRGTYEECLAWVAAVSGLE
jgi:hypothetical protein